jgi:uncharacterized lipoprotein YmbA
MKRLVVLATVLLGACSTAQPMDPFAHLCRAQSNESCPSDTDAPILLTGTPTTGSTATLSAK